MFLPWTGRIFGMQSLFIWFMSPFALTKSLTSLARCSCVFISDTSESLWLNRDHSAAPTCGMLLPPSIPCGNQQCVKMDCVSLPPLLAFKHLFYFFKVFQRYISPCFFGMSFLLPEGRVKGSELEWQSGLGMWGAGNSKNTVGRDSWSPLVLQWWSCRRWGSKLIHVPPQKWREDALKRSFSILCEILWLEAAR